jgi:hypothetical protein
MRFERAVVVVVVVVVFFSELVDFGPGRTLRKKVKTTLLFVTMQALLLLRHVFVVVVYVLTVYVFLFVGIILNVDWY